MGDRDTRYRPPEARKREDRKRVEDALADARRYGRGEDFDHLKKRNPSSRSLSRGVEFNPLGERNPSSRSLSPPIEEEMKRIQMNDNHLRELLKKYLDDNNPFSKTEYVKIAEPFKDLIDEPLLDNESNNNNIGNTVEFLAELHRPEILTEKYEYYKNKMNELNTKMIEPDTKSSTNTNDTERNNEFTEEINEVMNFWKLFSDILLITAELYEMVKTNEDEYLEDKYLDDIGKEDMLKTHI